MEKDNPKIKPIFIFSLPRSGSTLLQRILTTHSKISSVAEPWFLLQELYVFKDEGIYSEYWHDHMNVAMTDLFNELPNGRDDYLKEIRQLTLELYKKLSNEEARYFLDKTPRYHLIINDIINLFPEAKFIVLWRNPLSVISSLIESWQKGKWKIYQFHIDIYYGLNNIIQSYLKNKDRILAVNYEDLINNKESTIKIIVKYLNLKYEKEMIEGFNNTIFKGRMGDSIGTQNYQNVTNKTLNKWMATYNNVYRKYWAIKYLENIGELNLQLMGYNQKELITNIKGTKGYFSKLFSDIFYFVYGKIDSFLNFNIIKSNVKKIINRKRLTILR